MCRQLPPLRADGDIHQVLLVKKTLEGPDQLGLVVVPPETEPLVRHHDDMNVQICRARADCFSAVHSVSVLICSGPVPSAELSQRHGTGAGARILHCRNQGRQ